MKRHGVNQLTYTIGLRCGLHTFSNGRTLSDVKILNGQMDLFRDKGGGGEEVLVYLHHHNVPGVLPGARGTFVEVLWSISQK